MNTYSTIPNVLYDSQTPLQINDKTLKLNMSIVSDLTIVDDKLYGLVIVIDSSSSKGGLLTMELNTGKISTSNFYTTEQNTDEYVTLGEKRMLETDLPNYFVGPRRFVAIKTKKLIIVDDGVYVRL